MVNVNDLVVKKLYFQTNTQEMVTYLHSKNSQSGSKLHVFKSSEQLSSIEFLANHEGQILSLEEATPEQLKAASNIVEWIDPLTGSVQICPKKYIAKLPSNVGTGAVNAKTARVMLEAMGEKVTDTNARHLRQAALYLKQNGVQLISLRSSVGGYFVASSKEEVSVYTNEQRKLANSMIFEADKMDAVTVEDSLSKFSAMSL